MYTTKLRSQNNNNNKKTKPNKLHKQKKQVSTNIMDKSTTSPAPKRSRDIIQTSLIENTPAPKRLREVIQTTLQEKTPNNSLNSYSLYSTNSSSPLKLIQVMERRFEKLTEQLQTTIQTMFRECEDRLLNEIDKKLNAAMSDLINLTTKVSTLESVVQEIKCTATETIIALTNDNEIFKEEIETLKKYIRKHENSIVSTDIRINGIPYSQYENLQAIYFKLCQTVNINPPNTKAIFRVKNNITHRKFQSNSNNNNNTNDPAIIIKFKCPYDRNFVLKSITSYIKATNNFLRLNHIGFDSSVPFYVNENLTPENHRIFLQAHRLKKNGTISAAYTNRGLVYIKQLGEDDPVCITELKTLYQMFRSPDNEANNMEN